MDVDEEVRDLADLSNLGVDYSKIFQPDEDYVPADPDRDYYRCV